MRITIDRGTYSLPSPADKEELFYVRTRTYVAGRPATVVKFKYSQSSSSGLNYVVAFYFSPKKGSHEVPTMFVANVAGKKDQLVAEKMFKTIRFKA